MDNLNFLYGYFSTHMDYLFNCEDHFHFYIFVHISWTGLFTSIYQLQEIQFCFSNTLSCFTWVAFGPWEGEKEIGIFLLWRGGAFWERVEDFQTDSQWILTFKK